MVPVTGGFVGEIESSSKRVEAAFRCTNCRRMTIGTTRVPGNHPNPANGDDTWWNRVEFLSWTPHSMGGKDFPHVPEHVGSAADEAYRCRSVNALRAAILMARSVIEATCKDKGVEQGSLASKIDQMTEQGFIRTFTQQEAHELRYLGNNMAHGEFVHDVAAVDADSVLEVMTEILNEVYQGPARMKRMRERREQGRKA
jgi:Domain of unknown function (DUF4145)